MSGMKYTANELCKILESCGKSGVKSFEMGELKISFDSMESPHNLENELPQINISDFQEIPFIEKTDEEIEEEANLDILEVIDPVAAEQFQIEQLRGDR